MLRAMEKSFSSKSKLAEHKLFSLPGNSAFARARISLIYPHTAITGVGIFCRYISKIQPMKVHIGSLYSFSLQ